MSYRKRIKFFLVHTLRVSNKEADELIQSGKLKVNGNAVQENIFFEETDEILLGEKTLQKGFEYLYIRFYKPRGYQSTLSENVSDNLSQFFKQFQNVAIAGRLDKESEGLLLISNNGKWIREVTDPDSKKEKEYLVDLDREPDDDFFSKFRGGVELKFYTTRTAMCDKVGPTQIRVVLTEGKNRQIRKMCKTLGYNVLKLKRIRIDQFKLGNLKEGELDLT